MDDVIVRKATISDLEDIQKINMTLFELEYENFDDSLDVNWPLSSAGKEYFKEAINSDIVLVAVVNNIVVGYLAGTLNSQYSYNTNIQAELDNMCVLEEYRKFGIGKKMFLEFKKICADKGVDEIKVVASYKNTGAINFYKANGFEESELTLKQKINRRC